MVSLKTVKVLTRAAELVEQGWTQNCSARDETWQQVPPCDLRATRWCLGGAVVRAVYEIEGAVLPIEVGNALDWLNGTELANYHEAPVGMARHTVWNDRRERTADEVVACIRAAATRLEQVLA